MKRLRVVIVGAGVSSLACAHRLLKGVREKGLALDLQILEAGPRAGGVLSTVERDGFLMEEGAESFITDKPAALELAKELGLEGQFLRTNPDLKQSFILKGNKLHPIPEGFTLMAPARWRPLLASPLLSPWGKLRALMEPWVPRRRDPQDESAGAFVRRRLGREVFERLAQPLLGGVYNADPDDLSLSAAFPRFKEMERTQGSLVKALASRPLASQTSGARYSLFVSFQKGMGSLIQALTASLPPGALKLKTRVESIQRKDLDQWTLRLGDGTLEADALVLALPPHAMKPLIGHLDSEWDKLLSGIPAHDSATLNLAFPREGVGHPLNGFGFVVPERENKILLGCTFSSQKFDHRAPSGKVLIRAFLGAPGAQILKAEGEGAAIQRVLAELKPILGLKSPPLFTHLAFYEKAMSHFRPGHLSLAARVLQKASETPGLFLAGNGFTGVGIPDCVAGGQSAADKILAGFTA
ncbi:MAG TPA: protoporphyrinogen oxidase [bacterium]|nr:protoporphyrinogen oxidase [bacterium]